MATDYKTMATQAAQSAGVPVGLFLGLVQQESNWNPYAVSSAGAYGLAQLMPGTARELGVNSYDPQANLNGGARYLRQMYEKFGNWTDALGGYNAGPGGWGNVLAGKRNPPAETTNYISKVTGYAKSLFGFDVTANGGAGPTLLPTLNVPNAVPSNGGPAGEGYASPDDDGSATTRMLNRIFGPSPFATDDVDETGRPVPNTENPNSVGVDGANGFSQLAGNIGKLFTAEFWSEALVDITFILAIIALVLFGTYRVVKSNS